MTHISLSHLKANYYNIILINVYSVILAVVYGYWMYESNIRTLYCLLVAFGFLFIGIIISVITMSQYGKKHNSIN